VTASLEAVNQPLQVRPVRVLAEGQEPGSRAAVSYSITSSARSKSEVGSSMLRARAVVARPQVHPARPGPWQLQIIRRCAGTGSSRFQNAGSWSARAWISRCRRLARDYERHARKVAAFVSLAMIRLMLRRLKPTS
jgi:transposase